MATPIDYYMRPDPKTGLTDAEFLAHNTIRIQAKLTNGDISIGTGFLYQFLSTNKTPIPALVTNKHVLEGAETITLLFNPNGEDNKVDFKAEKLTYVITQFQDGWYRHPNPNVDLAFIPMGVILKQMAEGGAKPFMTFFRKENLPKPEEWSELTALEDVVIVGYPHGIWDSVNNLPIVRKGIAATHPKIDFEGRPEFLIDAAVYPGSSGSPVFLYNYEEVMMGRDLNLGKDKPRLAGTLYSVFYYKEEGELASMPIPTVKGKVPATYIPNNLGIVIKSTELDGFIPVIDKKLENEREDRLRMETQET